MHKNVTFLLAALLLEPTLTFARDGEGREDIKPKPVAPAQAQPGQPPPPPVFDIAAFGYLRVGYEHVQKDNRYDFIGRNSGFLLESARVGLEGTSDRYKVTFRVSAEGASDIQTAINTPIGYLDVRLRDAFARWDPVQFFGIQAGQFKAPWAEEELRGTADLLFASRAVAFEGVLPGRGLQERGIALDRQLGVMVAPKKPFYMGDFGFAYYGMVMNGNGANQMLDDNGKVGVVGRVEALYAKYVQLGGGVYSNERTVGSPPNLFNEKDLGLTADILVRAFNVEASAQVAQVRTEFPTVRSRDRTQTAWHAQLAYKVTVLPVHFAPAYRYAHYHPWAGGGDTATGQDYRSFRLDYHTFGVKVWHPNLPLTGWINYTLTTEPAVRSVDNNRLEILGQVTF